MKFREVPRGLTVGVACFARTTLRRACTCPRVALPSQTRMDPQCLTIQFVKNHIEIDIDIDIDVILIYPSVSKAPKFKGFRDW